MTDFEKKHPNISSECKIYKRLNMSGNLIEQYIRNSKGEMVEVTEIELLRQKINKLKRAMSSKKTRLKPLTVKPKTYFVSADRKNVIFIDDDNKKDKGCDGRLFTIIGKDFYFYTSNLWYSNEDFISLATKEYMFIIDGYVPEHILQEEIKDE